MYYMETNNDGQHENGLCHKRSSASVIERNISGMATIHQWKSSTKMVWIATHENAQQKAENNYYKWMNLFE